MTRAQSTASSGPPQRRPSARSSRRRASRSTASSAASHGSTSTRTPSSAIRSSGAAPVGPRGSTGLAVRRVQKRLTLAGYDTGGVDGIFGPATEAGVKALQRDRGLVEDGIVGPKTWDAIDALGD